MKLSELVSHPQRRPMVNGLNEIQTILLDMDGTLTRGSKPLPGLSDFFTFLRARAIAYTVVTNNTVKTPQEYTKKRNTAKVGR